MVPQTEIPVVLAGMKRVQDWIEQHNYLGYEPFDCLDSFLRPVAFGTLVGEIILQQVGRQCPVNLRPILGVKPRESSKGRGYIAWGHFQRYAATGKLEHRVKGEACLEWLVQNKSKLYEKYAWGNVFDYVSRSGSLPKDEPTIVWTGLIGQAFLLGYELTKNERWLKIADSSSSWIMDLGRDKTPTGDCLNYTMLGLNPVHNASMIGAACLARTAKHTGNKDYLTVAHSAMQYSCTRLLPDGAWWYGEHPKYHWVDNFHTGYNLDSLKRYIEYSGDQTFLPQLKLGFEYFRDHFTDPDGCPRYYHNRRQPIDIQGCAQVIDTLVFFSDMYPESLETAVKVAHWTMNNMQDADGHFYYRKYPLITATMPMIHWGQATMFKALAHLACRLEEVSKKTAAVGAT